MTQEITVSEILAAGLLIAAGASYLLRNYPRQTIVATTGLATYAATMAGYHRLVASLIPDAAPFWIRVLAHASVGAVGIAAVWIAINWISGLAQAVKNADRPERTGDEPS